MLELEDMTLVFLPHTGQLFLTGLVGGGLDQLFLLHCRNVLLKLVRLHLQPCNVLLKLDLGLSQCSHPSLHSHQQILGESL